MSKILLIELCDYTCSKSLEEEPNCWPALELLEAIDDE